MTDEEVMAQWQQVKTPLEALKTLLENQVFIGTDPYYRDLNIALWEMVDRVLESAYQPGP